MSEATIQQTIFGSFELMYREKSPDGNWEDKVVFEGTMEEAMEELDRRGEA